MKNATNQRQKDRVRGRPPKAKVGDIASVIDAIHNHQDKFDVQVVNSLPKMYATLMDQALAKGKFENIGIKDQTKAIEYCIKRAEQMLSEHYEEEIRSGMVPEEEGGDASDEHLEGTVEGDGEDYELDNVLALNVQN